MKSRIACLLPLIALAVTAAPTEVRDRARLNDQLKPLQFLIGDWAVEWETDDGAAMKVTKSAEPTAGGHAIRERGEWSRNGKQVRSWDSLTFKSEAPESFTTISVNSDGLRSKYTVRAKKGGLVCKQKAIDSAGKEATSDNHFKIVDKDTHTIHRVNIVIDGKTQPDWPVGIFKRVK